MLTTKFRFIWPSGFRGENKKKSANQKQELPMAAIFVNGSGQNEQSLERTFHRCFLPSFTSFGRGVSEEKIKMWKVNGRQMTDAKWWQKLTLPLARWAKNMDPHVQTQCTLGPSLVKGWICISQWQFTLYIMAFPLLILNTRGWKDNISSGIIMWLQLKLNNVHLLNI